jgi:hypothetical protein
MPLFLLSENGHMLVYSGEMELQPRPTQKAICLGQPEIYRPGRLTAGQ